MGDLTDFSVSASEPETLTYSQFEANQCQVASGAKRKASRYYSMAGEKNVYPRPTADHAGSCIAVIPTRDDWRDLLLQVFQHVVFLRSRNGYDAHGR